MNLKRIMVMALRELRLSPRSPVMIFALCMPFVITFVVQVVFQVIFNPAPRLAVHDQGNSVISSHLARKDSISLFTASSQASLKEMVRKNKVDAGLILQQDFDKSIKAKKQPLLQLYFSGKSKAMNRGLVTATLLDLIREVENRPSPVKVEVVSHGKAIPFDQLIQLFIIIFVLIVAGLFVPAFSLVQEKEAGTLSALLVTPVRMSEILASKAVFGLCISLPIAYMTILLNGLSVDPLAVTITLLAAALVCIEIGLIYGTAAKNSKTLFALIKTLNIFIIAPVIFYFFPDWPQWIPKFFPTWWFIDPLYQIAVKGAGLKEVAFSLLVCVAMMVLLLIPLSYFTHRLKTSLAND
ncbi:MAG: ABC transporter permease [Myxococcota bacterium]